MLQLGLVVAWLIALSLAIHLATKAIKARLLGRRVRKQALKTAREFRKNHHFDPKQKQWVRNVDQVALIDHSAGDRRIFLIFIFWLLFILWEGYWVSEIYEQYVARGRLELPYVFLFFMVVVVPLALYSFLRRRLRRVAIIPANIESRN
jgi:hypothetical protein